MKVRFVVFLLLLAWTAMVLVPGLSGAAEKVKIGIALRTHAVFVMPMLAAEEKGFWKQQGLDAEWLALRGGAAMGPAAAAYSWGRRALNLCSGVAACSGSPQPRLTLISFASDSGDRLGDGA